MSFNFAYPNPVQGCSSSCPEGDVKVYEDGQNPIGGASSKDGEGKKNVVFQSGNWAQPQPQQLSPSFTHSDGDLKNQDKKPLESNLYLSCKDFHYWMPPSVQVRGSSEFPRPPRSPRFKSKQSWQMNVSASKAASTTRRPLKTLLTS